MTQIYNNINTPLFIGRTYTTPPERCWDGKLDEVSVSNINQSAAWIKTSYQNQVNPSSFYTVGYNEILGNHPPQLSGEAPVNTTIDISVHQATVNVTVNDPEGDSFNWTIEGAYVNEAAGNNAFNGSKSATLITPLPYETQIIWYVNCTDNESGYWKNVTYSFTTSKAPIPWWNTDWSCRRLITINHTKVADSLLNFPLLVDIINASIGVYAQSNGNDFVFTDASGTVLHHEIELYTSSTGHLIAWVNITDLSADEDTIILLYYGNPTVENQQDLTGVWDSHYMMVQHLSETSGTHYDSTVNDNDGSPLGGITQGAIGQVDGADDFDGINDYVQVPHNNTISGFTQGLTASAWIQLDGNSTWVTILNKYNTSNSQRGWQLYYDGSLNPKELHFVLANTSTNYYSYLIPFDAATNTWYYITATWTSGQRPTIYVNGVAYTPTPTTTISSIYNNPLEPLYIGRSYIGGTSTGRYFDGRIDEVHISNTARLQAWVVTSYNNQNNPSNFYSISDQEENLNLQIKFDFDSGRIGSYIINGNIVNLTLYTEHLINSGVNYTYWTNFTVHNTLNKNITFHITNANLVPFLSNTAHEVQMVYSYDGINWSRLTNHTYSTGTYTFWKNFTQNEVQIATFFPFSYMTMQEYLETVNASQWTTKTVLGKSTQNRNITLLAITNSSIPNTTKKIVYIIGRQHAAETASSHMLNGLIDFLISNNSDARRMRDSFVWYIVPMVNPDGVYLGNTRGTSLLRDPNDDWSNTNSVEINIVKNHLTTTNNVLGVDFFIDWHSQMDDTSWYNYIYSPPGNTFFSILSKWTDFDTQTSPGVGGSSARGYATGLGIFTFTFEPTPHLSTWTLQSLQDQGEKTAYAIDEYFTKYTLTVSTVGNGTVTKDPDRPTYFYDDVVKLTATADANWSFDHWTGALSGSTNPVNLTITMNMTVSVHFTFNGPYTLSLTTSGTGSGTIQASPAGPYYWVLV